MYQNSLLQGLQCGAEGYSKAEVIFQVIADSASYVFILEFFEKESVAAATNRGQGFYISARAVAVRL